MTVALIQISPPQIVSIGDGATLRVNIPGKFQRDEAPVGWQTPDAAYRVVAVSAFSVPEGRVVAGIPSYAIDEMLNVTETYATVEVPPAPPGRPEIYGLANLTLAGGEITGFEMGSGLAGGFQADVGEFWLFLDQTFANSIYQIRAWDDAQTVKVRCGGEDRFDDYFILHCVDDLGAPADPATLNMQIYRVI